MPFKSNAQRRWMYSQEPEMAKRWEKETPKGKKLPEKLKGKRKALGGVNDPWATDPTPIVKNPNQPVFPLPLINEALRNGNAQDVMSLNGFGDEGRGWVVPHNGIESDQGYKAPDYTIDAIHKEGTNANGSPNWQINKDNDGKINPYFALRGMTSGLSWLSGIVDRGKQDQYVMQQMAQMGQNTPLPVSNFQPNPYQQYARMGGSLKKGGFKLNPENKGDCTPMTKSTCTGKKRQFAINAKNHFKKKEDGGYIEFPDGGAVPKKVDKVPDGYTPMDGKPNYFHKLGSKSLGVAQAAGSLRGGTEYESFLQNQLSSGVSPEELATKKYISGESVEKYRQYYKPTEDIVYIEPQTSPKADVSSYAQRGQPIYNTDKHIAGEIYYPTRNSSGVADGGALNTAAQKTKVQLRGDFGNIGNPFEVDGSELQNYLGTTHTFTSADAYNNFKNRATVGKMRKGGMLPKKADGGYEFLFGDDGELESDDKAKAAVVATEDDEPRPNYQKPEDSGMDEYNMTMDLASSNPEAKRKKMLYNLLNPYSSYNPTENPAPASDVSTSDKGKFAFNYLQKKGLPPHVAAGIVGNLEQESGRFRDDVIQAKESGTGDHGTAFGIAQWRGQRWTNMLNYAKSVGKNPYTLDAQLDFVVHEADQRGDLAAIHNTSNSADAAYLFAKRYERPKEVDPYRIKYAKKYH